MPVVARGWRRGLPPARDFRVSSCRSYHLAKHISRVSVIASRISKSNGTGDFPSSAIVGALWGIRLAAAIGFVIGTRSIGAAIIANTGQRRHRTGPIEPQG